MLYWHIHNWEKWQSYRNDRDQPPWIKLHREVLRNPEWVKMSDAERGQLVSIWMLAADSEGLVPADEQLIARLCYMTEPLSVEKLMDCGFVDRDAKLASEWRQVVAKVTPQKKNKKESKNIPPKSPKGDFPESVREAAAALTEIVNAKFNRRRKPDNRTLLRAVHLLVKEGYTAEQMAKVVRHRLAVQDWYDPDKYGIESLIRRDKFAGELERAEDSRSTKIVQYARLD